MTDTSQPMHAESQSWTLYAGDARCVLAGMPAGSANRIVTSPPYWGQRDDGAAGRHGHELCPGAYVETMRDGRDPRRVLAGDGTCWLNLGDPCSASSGGATGLRACPGPHITHRATGMHARNLIVSQGMLSAGWHARKPNGPGKFLCSSPEHDTPRRARACLLTDASSMAARYAPGRRPPLDAISQLAIAASGHVVQTPRRLGRIAPGRPAVSPGRTVHDVHVHAPARVPARNARACTAHKHAGACPRPIRRDHP